MPLLIGPSQPSRPVVFVGPSLARDEVERLLPGCIVRPPIRRGDLHGAPIPPGAVFVILDGVSGSGNAITGREILDVIGNHALVVGACAMGALRAAECWPGGMQGIGVVYRALRASAAISGDEVTVFDEDRVWSGRGWVSLVNVRYATSKLRRRGQIDQTMRERIIDAAENLPLPERRWDLILGSAGLDQRAEELAASLGAIDVHADDARRALGHVARQLRRSPPVNGGPPANEDLRGAGAAPSTPQDPTSAPVRTDPGDVRQELVRWLFVSGRFHRYLRGVRETVPRGPFGGEKKMTGAALQRFFAELDIFDQGDEDEWMHRLGLGPAPVDRGRTPESARSDLRLVARVLLGMDPSGGELWTEMVARGELERELAQLRTIRAAVEQARARGWRASRMHRYEAEQTIALDHLFSEWRELQAHAEHDGSLWWRLCAYRDELALACAARDRCFEPSLTC